MPDKGREVVQIINSSGGEARIVGGAVRNFLLGIKITDVDIATALKPDEVTRVFESRNIRVIPTGILFGTVTVVYEGRNYEITTLRKDIETDGRHAVVSYTSDWKQDASRRDFTFNALYMDEAGEIYDYFNGRDDLSKGIVRFIGNSEERIKEDYLRILRMFRFHAYYGKGNIIESQLEACRNLKAGLDNISGERIRTEMLKLLSSANAYNSLKAMYDSGILENISIADSNFEIEMVKNIYELDRYPNAIVALASILKSDVTDSDLEKLCSRWRLSNKEKQFLYRLRESLELDLTDDYQIRRSIRLNGREEFYDYAILNFAKKRIDIDKAAELIDMARNFAVPEFPLKSYDLIERGLKPGKEFGRIFREAEEYWEKEAYAPNKDMILAKISIKP